MIKLYETQSFLKECNTTVESCTENEGVVYIKLKESIFFPEEGGQYADTGVLEYADKCVNLIDGQIVDGEIIYQISEMIPEGTTVLCKLDWNKRFDRMQNHSGEHILSGLINSKYGFNNIGFHLSDDEFVTLNMDGVLTKEQVMELEKEVNSIIYANVPITDSYPSKEELANITYRSKIEIDGQVRLITIGDEKQTYDICACCAPHVARTGEIGILKITGVSKAKGGVLISILCGRRALEYINHSMDTLNALAGSFTTHPDNVPGIVENLKKECQELKAELSDYKERGLIDAIKANPLKNYVITADSLSPQNMKNVFNTLVDNCQGYVGVFVGTDEDGYRYYAGGKDCDAKVLSGLMREKLGAKGGGSSDMIQGKADTNAGSIEEFWNNICN